MTVGDEDHRRVAVRYSRDRREAYGVGRGGFVPFSVVGMVVRVVHKALRLLEAGRPSVPFIVI